MKLFLQKKPFATVALAGAFFSLLIVISCDPEDVVLDGGVAGTVINTLTGEPVANTTVTLVGFEQKTLITASDGVFRFSNLTIGTYELSAQNTNYKPNSITVKVETLDVVSSDIPLEPIPPLELSPTKLDFGNTKDQQNLVIKNTGSETFNYEVQSPNAWITLSKATGSLGSLNSDVLLVTVTRESLSTGNHEGTITFNVAGRGSVSIQVLITK